MDRRPGRRAKRELTQSEMMVLELIACGYETKEIAAQLCRAENTIKTRVWSILDKLGASTRANAVALAMRQGVLR